ncbi:MAG: hypothetical protein PHE21_00950 [Candidatus Dojkabacteria bacterium]|nr:hypothetical protein [Candidatus Dojkabacteria bacterium]
MKTLEIMSSVGDIISVIGVIAFIYTLIKKTTTAESKITTLIVISLGLVFSAIPRLVIAKDSLGSTIDLIIVILIFISVVLMLTETKDFRKLYDIIAYVIGSIAILTLLFCAIYRIILLWT